MQPTSVPRRVPRSDDGAHPLAAALPMRHWLRAETQAAHDRVDAVFGTLDLSELRGLALFLRAHGAAMAAVSEHLAGSAAGEQVAQAVALIAADLATLGARAITPADPAELSGAPALSVRYVVGGSHLGARLLRRRWAGATAPGVQQAGAYLGSDVLSPIWPDVLQELEAYGGDKDRLRDGALRTFVLFERAFEASVRADAGG